MQTEWKIGYLQTNWTIGSKQINKDGRLTIQNCAKMVI